MDSHWKVQEGSAEQTQAHSFQLPILGLEPEDAAVVAACCIETIRTK